LTDGLPTVPTNGPANAAIAAATWAKQNGTRLITIGLGTNVDGALLQTLASSTNDYHFASNTTVLQPIYTAISQSVCRDATNQPPAVSITYPAGSATFGPAPTNLTVTASATSASGAISQVEFFDGTNSLGINTTAPYHVNWKPVLGGSHALTAKATDTNGLATVSGLVTITVKNPPSVSITSPTNGTTIGPAPTNLTITATATADTGATITSVEFFQGTNSLGVDTTAPYGVTSNNVPPGTYTLMARATDSLGAKHNSSAVTITVYGTNLPPTVDAGSNQSVHLPNAAHLAGVVSDDGLPLGSTLAVTWTRLSGPGTITFADASQAATLATFSATGTNVLQLQASDGQFTRTGTVIITVLDTNLPPVVYAGTNQTLVLPALANTNTLGLIQWTTIATNFPYPTGLGYYIPSNCVVMSVNFDSGWPNNFELVSSNGYRSQFSTLSNLTNEVKIATARNTLGGFAIGDLFTGNGVAGEVMRIKPNGTTIGTNGTSHTAWAVLTNNAGTDPGLLRGALYVDETGVFGGDLIVSTTNGGVWRVNSAAQATKVAQIHDTNEFFFEGLTTVPNNLQKYGPWAGRILVGGEIANKIFAVDTNGFVVPYDLGIIAPENINLVADNENFFAIEENTFNLLGAAPSEFQGMSGDILISTEALGYPGSLYRVRWDGRAFQVEPIARNIEFEQAAFVPSGILNLPAVPSVRLHGSVADDGHLSSVPNIAWIMLSGPGPVIFDEPANPQSIARFTQPGTYTLRLTADDGQFISYDETKVEVVRNQPPTVDAGSDQFIAITNTTLTGIVRDDGLPKGQTNILWTQLSGPAAGTAFFTSSNQAVTAVSFNVAGTYVLRLRADDGQATNSAEVSVTVASPRLLLTPGYGGPTRTQTLFTVTATFLDVSNQPITNTTVDFVAFGNVDVTDSATTDVHGNASFTYSSGSNFGRDRIMATATNSGQTFTNSIFKDWACDLVCGQTNVHSDADLKSPSPEWPTNQVHWAHFYIFNGNTGDSIVLTKDQRYNLFADIHLMALVLRGPDHQLVAATGGNFLSCTLPASGDYTLEVVAREAGDYIPDYALGFSCNGSPFGPAIAVMRNGTNVPSGNTISLPTTTPGVATNLSLVVTNFGTADLVITNIATNGNFSVVATNLANPIAPGGSASFQVNFNSSSNGVSLGSLALAHNAGGGGWYTVYLVGSAFPGGTFPAIQLTSPTNNAAFFAPATATLTAAVQAGSSSVSYVNFQATGTNGVIPIGGCATAPYTAAWTNLPVGDYTVTATVVDSVGRSATTAPTTFHVWSANGNRPPTAIRDQVSVPANSTYNVFYPLGNDTDPDNDPLTIIAVGTPHLGTAQIINGGRAVSFTPTHGYRGGDYFSYTNSDGRGGIASANIDVTIQASDAPAVSITSPLNGATVTAGNSVTLQTAVTPSDFKGKVEFFLHNVKLGQVTNSPYNLNWTVIEDPCGCGIFAVATDIYGQIGSSASLYLNVVPPTNDIAPVARIDNLTNTVTLVNGHSVTNLPIVRDGLFELHGAAYDTDSANVSYAIYVLSPDGTLASDLTPYPRNADGFHTGSVPSAGGVLATNDFTMLRNGVYDLQLVVRGGYREASTTVRFGLDSNLKVGQFSFSQQDLVIPVNGIPLSVVRTYNSLNPDSRDFGYGWTYAIHDVDLQIDEQRVEEDSLFDDGDNGLQPSGKTFSLRVGGSRDVTLTLPGGQRTTFYYYLASATCNAGQDVRFCAQPMWQAAPGVYATLRLTDDNLKLTTLWSGLEWWSDNGSTKPDNYDFSSFILKTEDGTEYQINRENMGEHIFLGGTASGNYAHTYGKAHLTKITSRTGDQIRINPDQADGSFSIDHFTTNNVKTRSIVFQRDSLGRIISISDPNGLDMSGIPTGPAAVRYVYDASGNLSQVLRLTDRTASTYVTNSFSYTNTAFPHYITSIVDPSGNTPLRTLYDDQGRMIGTVDAFGHTNTFIPNFIARTETLVDRLGNTNTYNYDTRGNVTAITDALTNITQKAYDDLNNVIMTVDPLYHTNFYGYDAHGYQTAATNALGYFTLTTYNDQGQPRTNIDARGFGTTNTYDQVTGKLLGTTNALNQVTRFTYDADNRLISQTDAMGNSSTNGYDGFGNVTTAATLNSNGVVQASTTYIYDANGNRLQEITSRTLAGGGTQWMTNTFIYDGQNRLVQTIDALGYTNTTVYDANGRQQTTIDKLGHPTSFVYDDRGQLVSTIHPDWTTNSTAYDANGRQMATTNGLNQVTQYFYDAVGRLTNTLYPDLTTNATVYDAAGRVQYSIDARGFVRAPGYDALGQQTSMTNGYGTLQTNVMQYAYDAGGNRTNMVDGLNHTNSYFFDALSRMTNSTFPDGTKQITTFDALGRRIAQADQATNTTMFGYDALGRLTSVTNALGKVTRYGYDEVGNQTTQIDALNRQTTFEYDSLGRRTKRTLPMGTQSETFGYDAAGNQIAYTNFNSLVITNQYDVMNRLWQRWATNTVLEHYDYDAAGQTTNRTDTSGSYSWVYDAGGRVRTNATPVGTLYYQYDFNGNLTSLCSGTVNGVTNAYQYDALNRLTNVVDNALSGTKNTAYTFDGVGNLKSLKYPNGITNLCQYDALNQLTNLTWKLNGNQRGDFAYVLGPTGNRSNLVENVDGTGRTFLWQYDQLYRMTNETVSGSISGTLGYGYDDVGNRTNRTVSGTLASSGTLGATNNTFDVNDWLDNDGVTSNGNAWFDANGNTRTNGSNVYLYDYANRLTNAINGTNVVQITYGADGNRIRKVANGTNTLYLVSTINPSGYAQVVEELTISSGTTNLARVYTHGLSLISQKTLGSGATHFYGLDGHGSVRLLTDSTGLIANTYAYDAYGTLIASNAAIANVYLYAGEQYDPDLRLYYLRARYMDPNSGRFWSADTYQGTNEDPLSLHKYLYCQGNPVNGADPSGKAVYFVSRRLMRTGGAAWYNAVNSGHGYLLFTPTSDPGSADPFANGQPAIDTFSFHPNTWDYASKASIWNSLGAQAPGRVWELHPDDTNPSASHDTLLITTSAKDQNTLSSCIKNWISSNPVGFDVGNPKDDPNNPGNNTIGASGHKDSPANGAVYYSLGEQNCVWWATIMLKQSGISVPPTAYYAIADYNNNIGAATDVVYGKRSASTLNTLPYPPAVALPPGFSVDIGSVFGGH
jgi:RHS repeat-associated protein